jgi:glycosyltransferase involved in cell wall biosynthesis
MFESARGVIFLSKSEMELARQLYNLDHSRVGLVGDGLDLNVQGDAERFRRRTGIRDPFVLYVGRRDPTKNVPLLVESFRRYKAARETALKLVLIGSGDMVGAGDADADLIDLGFVSPQHKTDAMAAAAVLCQPSTNEAFSLVIMEAWLLGTPVLVHADCAVTVDHCQRSNGGLYFQDAAEFAACLDFLLSRPETARRMGELGGRYVRTNFNWDAVIRRFDHVLQS